MDGNIKTGSVNNLSSSSMLPFQQQSVHQQGNSTGNVNSYNNSQRISQHQARSYNSGNTFINNKNTPGSYRLRRFDDQNGNNGQWASTSSTRHNNIVGNGGLRSHRSYNKNSNSANRTNSDYWHKSTSSTINISGNTTNNNNSNQQQTDLTQQQSSHTKKNDENSEKFPRAFYQRVIT